MYRRLRARPANVALAALLGCIAAANLNCSSNTSGNNTTGGTGGTTGSTTGGTTGGSTTGGSTTGGTTGAPTYAKAASLGGQASSNVVNTGSSKPRRGLVPQGAGNSCANQTFSVYEVGSAGTTPVATGTSDAQGGFSVNWTAQVSDPNGVPPEVVVIFACATDATSHLKCYGKPGDSELICDVVGNAIVAALEDSVGGSVENSPLYKGLSIAKIVEGLVETIKLVSNLNPSNDIAAQLATGSDLQSLKAIITGSPVGALFQTIQTLAAQKRAENESTSTDDTSKSQVLQAVWDPGKVMAMLASLGIDISFSLDEGDDISPYDQIATFIDQASRTSFMAGVRRYVSDLYRQLYTGIYTQSTITFLCEARSRENWSLPPVSYPPDSTGTWQNPNAAADPNILRLTCRGATATTLGVNDPDKYEVRAHISGVFREADRNDPTGTHGNNDNFELRTGLVDIFPEFQRLMMPGGACADYVDTTGDHGPGPNTQWPELAACIQQNGADKYFAGVLGVYRFFTDATLQKDQFRLSMGDLYRALTDTLGVRLTTYLPFVSSWIPVQITDAPQGGDSYTSLPLLLLDTMAVENGRRVFHSYCPPALCANGLPEQQSMAVALTTAQYNEIIAASRPGFQTLFGDLQVIPTFDRIRASIFTSAHHVDYNTSGSQFYWVSGKDVTGDNQGDKPILCGILDPNNRPQLRFVPGATRVVCEAASGSWSDGVSDPQDPNYRAYKGWFALSQRESFGGDNYFALFDPQTGREFDDQGQQFRLRDVSNLPGNLRKEGGTDLLLDGETLYNTHKQYCYTYSDPSGAFQTRCWENVFEYVAVEFPNVNNPVNAADVSHSFYAPATYRPYSWPVQITQVNPDGQSYPMRLEIAVSTGTGNEDPRNPNAYSVCLLSDAVVVDPNDRSLVTDVSNVTASTVVNCASLFSGGTGGTSGGGGGQPSDPNTHPSDPNGMPPPPPPPPDPNAMPGDPNAGLRRLEVGGSTFYYLALDWNPDATVSTYKYNLVRSDGLYMRTSDMCQSPQGQYPCPAQVTMAALKAALPAQAVGPDTAQSFMPGYNLANPSHDPRFDPFCVDLDDSGRCDCIRDTSTNGSFNPNQLLNGASTPSDASCTLEDRAGREPTVANLPMPTDSPTWPRLQYVMKQCGNESGGGLKTCLTNLGQNYSPREMQVDWRNITFCAGTQSPPAYVDPAALIDNPNMAGGNCGGTNNPGPVTLLSIVPRNNAFDIARPQSVLKLISSATQNTGTGVTLDPNTPVFGFPDAVSMTYLRLTMPPDNIVIKGPNYRSPNGPSADPNTFIVYDAPPRFATVRSLGGSDNSPISAVLRAFLVKAGALSNP